MPRFLLLSPMTSLTLPNLLLLLVFLLSITTMHSFDYDPPLSQLRTLALDGHIDFNDVSLSHAARDFGNQRQLMPSAVMYPKSVSDISTLVRHIFQKGPCSQLTVAARGHGHSLLGQSQAPGGIVMLMESLQDESGIKVHAGNVPYVEASGGALWINVLKESLRHGLAPRSWTDYLHLTVGGTLSNAGVSGQAFRHGPQISNVYQLEVVTGYGEVMNCTAENNADLFFSVLGGLGQFGIITRAQIALEPAPQMVRWIRVLYTDFATFSQDQEMLITATRSFDYIEGFLIKNRTGLLDNWRSFLNPQDPIQASNFESQGRTLYCLELTKNFNPDTRNAMVQEVNSLLSKLRCIPHTLFQSEVPYLDFLDRVHASEVKLKSQGLWDVPHPWLNLLVPRSRIQEFANGVFDGIIKDSSNGPIIIYPVNKSKWNNRTSAVFLEEEIFYLVAFLSSVPSPSDVETLRCLLKRNRDILQFCQNAGIQVKQYLAHYTTTEEWKAHFGQRWDLFVRRKLTYDPLAILAPGQRIFQKAKPISEPPVYDQELSAN